MQFAGKVCDLQKEAITFLEIKEQNSDGLKALTGVRIWLLQLTTTGQQCGLNKTSRAKTSYIYV